MLQRDSLVAERCPSSALAKISAVPAFLGVRRTGGSRVIYRRFVGEDLSSLRNEAVDAGVIGPEETLRDPEVMKKFMDWAIGEEFVGISNR